MELQGLHSRDGFESVGLNPFYLHNSPALPISFNLRFDAESVFS